MTLLRQSVEIPAAPAVVYDYVTRPLRWKEWHSSSLEVQDVTDESLVAGRRFEEDVEAGGRRRHLQWMVEESRPGERWRASAYMEDGSTVRLTYEFATAGAGTRFTRTLEYVLAPTFLRWMNDLFLWKRVEKESQAALDRLRGRFAG
ncbi:MAG TPA: SRPBCC family protein [Moraxellaceae bacterium]|nr:SRPBCC family protein [Moraxellaceae bacterium]